MWEKVQEEQHPSCYLKRNGDEMWKNLAENNERILIDLDIVKHYIAYSLSVSHNGQDKWKK